MDQTIFSCIVLCLSLPVQSFGLSLSNRIVVESQHRDFYRVDVAGSNLRPPPTTPTTTPYPTTTTPGTNGTTTYPTTTSTATPYTDTTTTTTPYPTTTTSYPTTTTPYPTTTTSYPTTTTPYPTTTTPYPTTTTPYPTSTTPSPPTNCNLAKLIVHHFPGPCQAEITCLNGQSFIVNGCINTLTFISQITGTGVKPSPQ